MLVKKLIKNLNKLNMSKTKLQNILYVILAIGVLYTVYKNYEMASPLNKYYKVKYSKVKPEVSEMYLMEEITDSAEIVKAGFKYKN